MPQKGQQHSIEKSQILQRKLYLAAKKNRNRRFHALYDRICRPDILWRAWIEVKKNKGSAGVDGITIDQVANGNVQKCLQEIQQELQQGTYKPQPVLRVYIPKADGTKRPLGIPTVKDRIIQQACKIIIEPIYEANFLETSFGFRPKKSATQAIKAIKETLVRGWWVVDLDISKYFDTIDHKILISLVKRRISDRNVLKLLKRWLKVGVIEDGQHTPSDIGSPQGGVISPLLANIYLHVLDAYWKENCEKIGEIFRYADDAVIICRTERQAIKALQIVEQIASRLKLTLHPDKTKIVNMNHEGFDFLGYHFHKMHSRRTGKLVPFAWPSTKAMNKVRSTIRDITSRNNLRKTMQEIVDELNPVIRGWRNYFSIGNSTKKFQDLDRYTRKRLIELLRIRLRKTRKRKRETCKHWLDKVTLEYFYPKGIYGI
ncbi:group II intron reverse transcriptase/maturase [Desulfuribacillus alkaliarsenatis]|uniref:Group II intron reverse transcriptase/maturase n=1 Tax=Desulfuribacillus alkaliarsenatis TaxID=766136 RepID=A0A1E5G3C4_9FIRM|nr:group II intron reverse transcriptase/maturase [Desulfuribacillus alkaliarsenatis]OEF97558.1 group II intron reverse transcriptase/maturase [Desulfuribacillus alkaliarsenatis]